MSFEETNFSVGNERGSRAWPWTALSKTIETPNFFHLYFDSRSFFLVPKYAFPDDDALYQMRLLLREKVKG
jgi:hypothetical protein